MRRTLLDSHENLVLNTPETSRSAVVPETENPYRQESMVLTDLADPSLRRVAVSRLRADNKEEQRGKLLLGRSSLAFLRHNQELAFSHSYLCISSYNIVDDKLSYTLNVDGVERAYHFYLDEPLAPREIDTQLAACIAAANKKDGGRRGSTIKPRSGSWIKVGRAGGSPRGPATEATPEIVGTRFVIKVTSVDFTLRLLC
jgi:hypothetical protein